jgi:nucleotide-binding universal stress UspA family protein
MFSKILLATDGSEHSLKAASLALELAEKNSAQVEMIHVAQYLHEPVPYTELQVAIKLKDSQKFIARMKEQGQEVVKKTAQIFAEKNVPYTSKVEVGDPADIICREAEEQGVDLIIIGTRGISGVSRFLLGSVSSKVVSHAPCSVLVVR